MKRLVLIAAGSVLLGCGFGSLIEACGGGDDSGVSNTDGGGSNNDATTSAGDGSVTTNDGGVVVTEGGSTTDGGGSGPKSNPGEATCGPTLTCDVDAGNGAGPELNRPYCCERSDGGDSCETMNAACPATAVRLECDEPADCPANKHSCCAQIMDLGAGPTADGGVSTGTAACNDKCTGQDLILCKTAADCGDSGACSQVTCKGGDTFYACNTNNDCK